MTSNVKSREALRGMFRAEVRQVSAVWWWFLVLGIVWTGLGMYVLSYRVGSLATVAALVGGVFLFGGVAQLVVASRIQSWRWLFVLVGILGVIAGILAFVWPGITLYVVSILAAWYLIVFGIIHIIDALAGPKLALPDLECEGSAVQERSDPVVDQIAEAEGVASEGFEAAVDGLGRAVRGPVSEVGQDVVAAPVQGAPEGGEFLEPAR